MVVERCELCEGENDGPVKCGPSLCVGCVLGLPAGLARLRRDLVRLGETVQEQRREIVGLRGDLAVKNGLIRGWFEGISFTN